MKRTIHLATGNAHKVAEFRALARSGAATVAPGLEIEIAVPARLPEVVEDTGTFMGNARKKALALKQQLPAGAWVLADDSGLVVDYLDGAPGVESAYYAGPQADWSANLQKLMEAMRGVPPEKRRAHFYCVLFLTGGDGLEMAFEGRCDGRVAEVASGRRGFGYDPIFLPEGYAGTYSELTEEEKNRISHRGRAWAEFARWLRSTGV